MRQNKFETRNISNVKQFVKIKLLLAKKVYVFVMCQNPHDT